MTAKEIEFVMEIIRTCASLINIPAAIIGIVIGIRVMWKWRKKSKRKRKEG